MCSVLSSLWSLTNRISNEMPASMSVACSLATVGRTQPSSLWAGITIESLMTPPTIGSHFGDDKRLLPQQPRKVRDSEIDSYQSWHFRWFTRRRARQKTDMQS